MIVYSLKNYSNKKGTKMKELTRVESIDPETAQVYLDQLMKGQRKVKPGQVNLLASEMLKGNWTLSNDAITFIKGKLANGQHRLRAVIKSGVTCEFFVYRTNEDVYLSIDSAVKRNNNDVLSFYGIKNAFQISAACNLYIRYTNHDKGLTKNSISKSLLLETANEKKELFEASLETAARLYVKQPIITTTAMTVFIILARENTRLSQGEEFLEQLITGDNLVPVSKTLRNFLINNKIRGTTLRSETLLILLINVFKAWLSGIKRIGIKQINLKEHIEM
jgi:azurin